MTIAINLLTGTELSFDDATAPEWVVAYGYCEEHNLMSWLFSMCRSNDMARAYEKLPFVYGKNSVACGDWATKL